MADLEGLAPTRIDAALMAALQALTEVQDDPDADQELWNQVELVKRNIAVSPKRPLG